MLPVQTRSYPPRDMIKPDPLAGQIMASGMRYHHSTLRISSGACVFSCSLVGTATRHQFSHATLVDDGIELTEDVQGGRADWRREEGIASGVSGAESAVEDCEFQGPLSLIWFSLFHVCLRLLPCLRVGELEFGWQFASLWRRWVSLGLVGFFERGHHHGGHSGSLAEPDHAVKGSLVTDCLPDRREPLHHPLVHDRIIACASPPAEILELVIGTRNAVLFPRGRQTERRMGRRGFVEGKNDAVGTGREGKGDGIMGKKGLSEGFLQTATFGVEAGAGLGEAYFASRVNQCFRGG